MANTNFAVTPLLGAGLDSRRTTAPEFTVGTAAIGNGNTTWVYVKATEAVTGTCTVDGSFNLTDAAGNYTAPAAFASGEYGWVKKTTSPL